ncbi:MAG TPA: DNA primase [Opitutaceae bacterium]|jgi:DNA primase
MPVIKESSIRDLKLRINIADVVGRTVSLRKAGARMKGLCPFHHEKTPSFHVDPDKGFYKCFGCGKAGDIISFVRETEQLDFSEAVEALGQRFGVPVEYNEGAGPTAQDRSLRQELFDLHEQAAEYYHEVFRSSHPAGEYLRKYWTEDRRFTAELAAEFKIGAAPADDGGLAARLLKRKYSEEALRDCGLFFIREGAVLTTGALRSRFRGRLMIPIRDHQGRVVAFTARQTAITPTEDPSHEAKYVNSPETPIFTKGHLLFNLDRARTAAGEGDPFVMVEGQLDALRCWSVGLKTAVAPQGTAITDGQLLLLRRYHPEIECLFDSDSAGQKAALRLLPLALKAGVEVRFLGGSSATKLDPDLLFLEKGMAAYAELKAGAQSAMAFACRAALAAVGGATSAEQRHRAAQTVLDIIAHSESAVIRDQFVAEAARHLNLSPTALAADFSQLLARRERSASYSSAREPARPGAALPRPPGSPGALSIGSVEMDLLTVLLHHEAIGKPLSAALPATWIDQGAPAGSLLNRFLAEFEQGNWPGRDQLDALIESEDEKTLVASVIFDSPRFEEPLKIVQEGLRKLRDRALLPRIREIELALAESTEDSKIDHTSLLIEKRDLHRQLSRPITLATQG